MAACSYIHTYVPASQEQSRRSLPGVVGLARGLSCGSRSQPAGLLRCPLSTASRPPAKKVSVPRHSSSTRDMCSRHRIDCVCQHVTLDFAGAGAKKLVVNRHQYRFRAFNLIPKIMPSFRGVTGGVPRSVQCTPGRVV